MAAIHPPEPSADPGQFWPWTPSSWPASGELHLWPWSQSTLRSLPLACPDWLSAIESTRLAGISPGRREDALRVRCAVRAALASYLEIVPAKLCFTYGSHGKPELTRQPDLQFSIAHSAGHVLLAVSGSSPVGVDVERVRQPPRDGLAERLLGPGAWLHYRSLDDQARGQAFTQAWAEREALVKALGLGIGDGWGLCRSLFNESPLQVAPPGPGRVAGWHLRSLPAWPGLVAVGCTAGYPADLRWQLPLGASP